MRTTDNQIFKIIVGVVLLAAFTLLPLFTDGAEAANQDADVVIVGAGISGLSAALEAARGGARVAVVDMASVFGGHAVMSEGQVSIIGTPLQESRNIRDSPELAYRDFIEWGEDANADWVRYYVSNSRLEILRLAHGYRGKVCDPHTIARQQRPAITRTSGTRFRSCQPALPRMCDTSWDHVCLEHSDYRLDR